jgi:hypothetical protein
MGEHPDLLDLETVTLDAGQVQLAEDSLWHGRPARELKVKDRITGTTGFG